MQPSIQSADLALAIYLEPLASKRRVLWLGEAHGGAPSRLARIAAQVRVLSPSANRVDGLRVSKLTPGPLSLPEDGFDLIVAPDLGAVGLDEPDRISELHAALSSSGLLLAGAPVGQGETAYERLFELLGQRFRNTRMLGQTSFDAWAVVDFRAAERGVSEVVIDGSGVEAGGDHPLRALAWASDDVKLRVDPYAVVRVPSVQAKAADISTRRELQRELEVALDRSEELDHRLGEMERALRDRTDELDETRSRLKTDRGESNRQDFDRLEESLRERSLEVREAQSEIERLERLSRDLIEQMKEGMASVSSSAQTLGIVPTLRPTVASPSSRAAMERAVAAEAARAEAEFQADELRGLLLETERNRREWAHEEARLLGRFRGLQVRSAELALAFEAAEARASSAVLELDDSRRRARTLQRELDELRPRKGEEVQERLPLQAPTGDTRSGDAAGLRGEIAGLRDRLADRGAALDAAKVDTRTLPELRRGLEAARGELGKVRAELGEARAALDDQGKLEKRAKEAEAETDRLRQALPARASSVPPRVQDEMANLGAESADLRERLATSDATCEEQRVRIAELSSALGARDALVSRLQIDLAGSERRRDDFDDQTDRLREENRRLRDALVDASDRVDEASALQTKLSQAEAVARRKGEALHEAQGSARERQDAVVTAERERDFAREQREVLRRDLEQGREFLRQTLREVRQGLDGLSGVLGANASTTLAEITAVGIASPDDGFDRSDEMAALRERVETLQREAADHDTLLHSTRAQLEERDDRIRALEGRLANRATFQVSEEALHQELLELRERSSRLSEELEHERRARAIGARNGPSSAPQALRPAEAGQDHPLAAPGRERELKGLREANAQARAGLEELLGATTMSDPATAERIGALLRILR